jgi:hypothetical protein
MSILDGFKTCRKGLHTYPREKQRCPECQKIHQQNWYKRNKKKHKELMQKWYKNNKEKALANMKIWREKNLKLARKKSNENALKWQRKNKERVNATQAKRRAVKKQALPLWADLNAIKQIYKQAAELTKATGILYEVDHIYPLQSKYMCGLHVENNLQILTKAENSAKRNLIWPGQLDCQKD